MMKFFTLVSLVGVWELVLLLIACSCIRYTQAGAGQAQQLHVASAFDAPRTGAPYPASLISTRVDLVHRDGALSKPPAHIKAAMVEMLMRENDRIAFIKAKLHLGEPDNEQLQSSMQTPLYSGQTIGSGNYIMTIALGTPPQQLSMMIDTGSDLAWTQCAPCNVCYNQTHPIFNPSASSSYKQVACGSTECSQLGSAFKKPCIGNICRYQGKYLDGSTTTGDFVVDSLSVGGGAAILAAYPFGCGHQNIGLFSGSDGLLGFSRDPLAFPAQTKTTFGQTFAYCLPPIFSSSPGYMEFGTVAGGPGSVNTPLVGLSSSSMYTVVLESIQFKGSSTIIVPPTNKSFVVDSGTTITRLDTPLYNEVRNSFRMATSPNVTASSPPHGFDTCYRLSNISFANIDQTFPSVTFTLMGGLYLTAPAHNLLVPIDDDGIVCLALLPLDFNGVSILGNYQQQGHRFTFDIASSTLSISSGGAC